MRHFWLDRILELEPGVQATGVKSVGLAEDYFEAHFPGNPVFPGIYVLEGMAQTAGVLLIESTGGQSLAVMASIERARFSHFARPGDRIHFAVEIESHENHLARVRGVATVDDRPIASARFVFKMVPPETLIPPVYRPFWQQMIETWQGRYPDPADE